MADLRREYGLNLLDLWRGRLSFFELCVYLAGLPAESPTGCLMRDLPSELEGWGLREQLLGALLDAVRAQWAEEAPESCLPRALFEERPAEPVKPELQPDGAATALLVSPQDFVTAHGR